MNRSRSNKPKKKHVPFKMPTAVQILVPCRGCGGQGPHFVPPSFGDEGFFICSMEKIDDRPLDSA